MATCIPFPGVHASPPARPAEPMPLPWLVASIAHELSQPLTAIVSDACASRRRLAAAELDVAEIRASLDAIVRDAERAGEVLARIRMLASQTGTIAACCDLDAVIGEALVLTRMELERCGVELIRELASGLPQARVDGVGLRQVLANLVRNAIEACRCLPASRRRIVVRAHARADGSLCVEIEDAGIGIDGDPQRLFEPYYTTKATAGSGIGLSLSRAIVQRHGGDIRAAGNLGPGATFRVTLPSAAVPTDGHAVPVGRHPRRRAR